MFKALTLVCLITVTTGCHYLTGENGPFRDRGDDFMEAQVLPAMSIPDELDSYTIDELYVIPAAVNLELQAFTEIPLPKPIETNRREGVIIQNLDGRSWIVLDANPGQVWTLVRDYWAQLQVVLEYENPSSGIMETSWLEVDSNVETRHKYRVTIEPGLHSGYSEIYIIHLQSPRSEPIPTLITWPEVSSEKDGEQQIITSLSQYLADRNDVYQASSASLLAGSIEAARKANIVADGQGGQVLELRLSYSRAWVLVRSSIEDAGITILDNDRDLAFINVRFAGIDEETEEPGFFARLFRRGKRDAEMQEQDFTVRLIEDGDQVKIIAEALETDSDLTELSVELLQLINDNLT